MPARPPPEETMFLVSRRMISLVSLLMVATRRERGSLDGGRLRASTAEVSNGGWTGPCKRQRRAEVVGEGGGAWCFVYGRLGLRGM